MIKKEWIFEGVVERIIDGDTYDVMVDCGFRRYSQERLRLLEVDTPEVRGPERPEGLKATAFVEALIPVGSTITFKSYEHDSFGRWLADVYYLDADGTMQRLADTILEHDMGELFVG